MNFVSRGEDARRQGFCQTQPKRRHKEKLVVSMKLLCSRGSQQQGKNRDKPARLQKKQKGAPRKAFCPYYLCNKHRLPFVGTHNNDAGLGGDSLPIKAVQSHHLQFSLVRCPVLRPIFITMCTPYHSTSLAAVRNAMKPRRPVFAANFRHKRLWRAWTGLQG